MIKIIIDRFEGDTAFAELPDGSMTHLPRVLVPDAKEGDVVVISKDLDETERRKAAIEKLVKEVWND